MSQTGASMTQRAEASGRRFIQEDRYALVLLLIISTILCTAFLGDGSAGVILTLGLVCVTLVVILATSNASVHAQRIGRLAVLLSFIGVVAAELLDYLAAARLGFYCAMLVLTVVCPLVIGRRLYRQDAVKLNTVAGAADIYLLVGLFFALVYGLIGSIQAGYFDSFASLAVARTTPSSAFFHASRETYSSDFVYYSFTTLSTVGYGDLTSTSSLGRMISISEGLLGQLYLVTVVAILVSNLGHFKRRRVGGDEDGGPRPETENGARSRNSSTP
jgi:hypothetical protein